MEPRSDAVYFCSLDERKPRPQTIGQALHELDRCRYGVLLGIKLRGGEHEAATNGVWVPLEISMLGPTRYEVRHQTPTSPFAVEVDANEVETHRAFASAIIDAVLELFDVSMEQPRCVDGFRRG